MPKLTPNEAKTIRRAWLAASGTPEEKQAIVRAEVGLSHPDAELLAEMTDRAVQRTAREDFAGLCISLQRQAALLAPKEPEPEETDATDWEDAESTEDERTDTQPPPA